MSLRSKFSPTVLREWIEGKRATTGGEPGPVLGTTSPSPPPPRARRSSKRARSQPKETVLPKPTALSTPLEYHAKIKKAEPTVPGALVERDQHAVSALARKHRLSQVEAEELYDLLDHVRLMGFSTSSELSRHITDNRLGYSYPNISGIVEYEEDGRYWDLEGGFPTPIFRIVCKKLGLKHKGTKARPVGFRPWKSLFGLRRK